MPRRSHALGEPESDGASAKRSRSIGQHFRLWLAIFLAGVVVFVVFDAARPGHRGDARVEQRAPRSRAELARARVRPPDATTLRGVSLGQISNAGGKTSLVAKELEFRKRIGLRGYLVYHDARDLVVRDAVFDIKLGEGVAFDFPSIPTEISLLLGLEGGDFEGSSLLEGIAQDASGAFLSRIRFESVSISMTSASGLRLEIDAPKGRFTPMTRTLSLGGGLEIKAPSGEVIRTGQAIVSPDLSGLYLPMSHSRKAGRVAERSELSVDASGKLQTRLKPGRVGVVDPLDELEHIFLTKYLKKLPPAIRAGFFPGLSAGDAQAPAQ